MEKPIPQDKKAEMAVLGSILIDADAIVQMADFLLPVHFYHDRHRIIYEAMLRVFARHEPIDYILVGEELAKENKLELVEGYAYLTDLINRVPTSGNAEYYAKIVKKKWTNRELMKVGGEIAAAGMKEDEDALEMAQNLIFKIAQGDTKKAIANHPDALSRYMIHLDTLHDECASGKVPGIATGFPVLDLKLGGFRKEKFYVFAGRPGTGKTALILNFIDAAVKAGKNVLVFSLEMDEKELMQRWIAMESQVDSQHLRDGRLTNDTDSYGLTEWERVYAAEERLRKLPGKLFIDDTPSQTDVAIRAKARKMHMEHGIDMICIDYLQLAKAAGADEKKLNRQLEVAQISGALRLLCREMRVPVIALAQMSRAVEGRADRKPQLSDLREAGDIEQDANVVTFLYKNPDISDDESSYPIELSIKKNRDGEDGPVPLYFIGAHTKFHSHVKEPQL